MIKLTYEFSSEEELQAFLASRGNSAEASTTAKKTTAKKTTTKAEVAPVVEPVVAEVPQASANPFGTNFGPTVQTQATVQAQPVVQQAEPVESSYNVDAIKSEMNNIFSTLQSRGMTPQEIGAKFGEIFAHFGWTPVKVGDLPPAQMFQFYQAAKTLVNAPASNQSLI